MAGSAFACWMDDGGNMCSQYVDRVDLIGKKIVCLVGEMGKIDLNFKERSGLSNCTVVKCFCIPPTSEVEEIVIKTSSFVQVPNQISERKLGKKLK